ncbi:hypothetical protein PM082_001141 [Marasmius tenuissimus]|nr:hypothetical protein PM082_001141 [Marasmius tenuissimus]
MGDKNQSLSATNLATYHHFNCDLYLHNIYHKPNEAEVTGKGQARTDELSKARFRRGISWEQHLIDWLDEENLLLKVDTVPKTAEDLKNHMDWDDRERFFIAGFTFWPPQEQLDFLFEKSRQSPVKFGLAKPDLLEITRLENGVKVWRVVDAKASSSVKTSHHVQIYFYTLCLQHLLLEPDFQPSTTAAIWLPPAGGFDEELPSFEDLRPVDLSLLSSPLDRFLFRGLPQVLSTPRDQVSWHLNPNCAGCPYTLGCSRRAVEDGSLGGMSNISLGHAKVLGTVLSLWRNEKGPRDTGKDISDIEDLNKLFEDGEFVQRLSRSNPITVRKAKRILALPARARDTRPMKSSLVEAARTKEIQIIPRRNSTLPKGEDIAVVLSLISDPSSPTIQIVAFCISVFTHLRSIQLPQHVQGGKADLVPSLAQIIRTLTSLDDVLPSAQFYVFSSAENAALQAHLVQTALNSTESNDDVRVCIGALAQGASSLQTTFQPPVLEYGLLGFLANKQRRRNELVACLERMNLPTHGNMEDLRQRITSELERFRNMGDQETDDRRKEFAQLPRVVSLKSEIERSLALPIPGFWELQDCARMLAPSADVACPTDEQLFAAYQNERPTQFLLQKRNRFIFSVLRSLRNLLRTSNLNILINPAKPLSVNFMELCREDSLRKLFYMQQFEVLAKLSELWKSRIEGSPDAPILEYRSMQEVGETTEYIFHLKSGSLDMPISEKGKHFFGHIIAPDDEDDLNEVPTEVLFDDLALSGLVLSFNESRWKSQHPLVREKLAVADICDMSLQGGQTLVAVRAWPRAGNRLSFAEGCHYRISPRLVDFNTSKVLSALFELDLRNDGGDPVPFLQLVHDPKSFRSDITLSPETVKSMAKAEGGIQRTFDELSKNLDVERAGPLRLKPSQKRATHHILSHRLSVIWGPPGTGKTHTIALSLLRLLNIQYLLGHEPSKVIFITAMTHAAIDAFLGKLKYLTECYRAIEGLDIEWLDAIKVEHVLSGQKHPRTTLSRTTIFAGTIYQLYNLCKDRRLEADLILIDEAGQLALSSASLVLRALSSTGKVVVAGDQEQLSPILTAQYPSLKSGPLFGSVLDRLVHFSRRLGGWYPSRSNKSVSSGSTESEEEGFSQGSVVQLEENFRLNPDLGEFIEIIYSKAFVPQKSQTRQLATALNRVRYDLICNFGLDEHVVEKAQLFLLALSCVLARHPQATLAQPLVKTKKPVSVARLARADSDSSVGEHMPVSLTLVRLKVGEGTEVSYEAHVKAEAMLAAALVLQLQRCLPGEDIFVATPHRVQRQAVWAALRSAKSQGSEDALDTLLEGLSLEEATEPPKKKGKLIVDTVERLQGAEAAFVIGLFSLPASEVSGLKFLLERRRLNVAISRAKTLCILISSSEVLRPRVEILADNEAAKGYTFLKHYEDRAWSMEIQVDMKDL